MCTLLALLGTVPGYPLVVAMNRDEFYDRPSLPPAVRTAPTRLVAPRDARAEGTWIGVNERGVVAALSNRYGGATDSAARSRGLLCLESLAKPTASEAAMFAAEAAESQTYNGFNLLHGDAKRLVCTSHGDGTWAVHGTMGANVLTNAGLNADDPRCIRAKSLLLPPEFRDLEDAFARLRGVLADHADAGGRAICHHGEKTGTRSQTIVAVSERGWRGNRLWHTEGHPCTATPQDLSALFR